MGRSLKGSSEGRHQSTLPVCSNVQSQKGQMTWSNSRPFDLWMEIRRMPLLSSLWMVLPQRLSSHSWRNVSMSLVFSLMKSVSWS